MEESSSVSEETRIVELKRANLRKSFDQAHAQASEILKFTLKWKDLENHIELIKRDLERKFLEVELQRQEVETRRVAVEERASDIEAAERELGDLKGKVKTLHKEIEVKEKELALLDIKVEESSREFRIKDGELSKVRKFIEDCSVELISKRKELGSVQKWIEESRGNLESTEKQLGLVQKELSRCRGDLNSEKEGLGLVQKAVQEFRKEMGKKEAELAECYCQLSVERMQLDSVQKSLEAQSFELESKQKELDAIRGSIKEYNHELELKETRLQSLNNAIKDRCIELDSKCIELTEIQTLIVEQVEELAKKLEHSDSIKLLIKENEEELEAKENQYNTILKSMENCSFELKSKQKKLDMTEESIQKVSGKLLSKEKELDSLQKRLKQRATELHSKEKQLNLAKEMLKKYNDDVELKDREFNALQTCIREREREKESSEAKLECIKISIEEFSKTLKAKEDELSSIQKLIAECSEELESKKNDLDLIEKSVKERSHKLLLKEQELDSIKKKTRETMKEFEVKEKHCNSAEKSLKERAEELEVKSKKFYSRVEAFEQKERQFDARVKEFEQKEKQLDSSRKQVEKCIEKMELKAKQLSSFCQQGNSEQPGNFLGNRFVESTSVTLQVDDGMNLQLFLNEHLKRQELVHAKISDALKTSSDPAQLVLDAMQGFYPPHPRKEDMEFDESIVRRSCIILLERLMVLAPPIKPKVHGEAMKLASEWKAKLVVKAENSAEVMGFLHLLAAFDLASAFSADELWSLHGVVNHCTHAPHLDQALGLSPATPASKAPLSQLKTEQPHHLPGNSSLSSPSANIRNNDAMVVNQNSVLPPNGYDMIHSEVSAAQRHDEVPADLRQVEVLAALRQDEVSTAFRLDELSAALRPDEVSNALHLSSNPWRFVLDLMQGTITQNLKHGDTALEETLVKNCILMLEGLMRIPQRISLQTQSEAMKLAVEWKRKMRAGNALEGLGFLLLLAAYGLGSNFDREEVFELLWGVIQYKHAPKICQALGFSRIVPDIISTLIDKEQCIAAVRFICSFNLRNNFQPVPLLKRELENLTRCSSNMDKGTEAQVEAREAAVLGAILELVAHYNVQIELPAALVVKFVFHPQARHIMDHVSSQRYQPIPIPPLQHEAHYALNYQAGSTTSPHQLQQHIGNKRPQVDVQAIGAQATRIRRSDHV